MIIYVLIVNNKFIPHNIEQIQAFYKSNLNTIRIVFDLVFAIVHLLLLLKRCFFLECQQVDNIDYCFLDCLGNRKIETRKLIVCTFLHYASCIQIISRTTSILILLLNYFFRVNSIDLSLS